MTDGYFKQQGTNEMGRLKMCRAGGPRCDAKWGRAHKARAAAHRRLNRIIKSDESGNVVINGDNVSADAVIPSASRRSIAEKVAELAGREEKVDTEGLDQGASSWADVFNENPEGDGKDGDGSEDVDSPEDYWKKLPATVDPFVLRYVEGESGTEDDIRKVFADGAVPRSQSRAPIIVGRAQAVDDYVSSNAVERAKPTILFLDVEEVPFMDDSLGHTHPSGDNIQIVSSPTPAVLTSAPPTRSLPSGNTYRVLTSSAIPVRGTGKALIPAGKGLVVVGKHRGVNGDIIDLAEPSVLRKTRHRRD